MSRAEFGLYEWAGRTIERHRGQVRAHLGFRECSVAEAGRSPRTTVRRSRRPPCACASSGPRSSTSTP
ncbi:hypothetical protein ACWGJX_14735 [Streptomyces sp. NPDC054775]